MLQPFTPQFLPVALSDTEVISLLRKETDARVKIERFNSLLERSVIQKELIMLFSMDESIQSTRLEGTQTTASEVFEAELTGKGNQDTQEVLNYLEAIDLGATLLHTLPLSTRVFLKLHEVILANSRGKNRNPGEYRKIQNFIGPTKRIEDATYIPPEPQLVPELISNLERYINDEYEDSFGYLIRAGIVHGQFESIHPFLDGNGRLGRILLILYLYEKKVTSYPAFFISEELERNKYKYYTMLNGLRTDSPKWYDWLLFFLQSAEQQAENYIEKLSKIEALYEKLTSFAEQHAISHEFVKLMFSTPMFHVKTMSQKLLLSEGTIRRYCNIFIENHLIYSDDKPRNRQYILYDLLDIIR